MMMKKVICAMLVLFALTAYAAASASEEHYKVQAVVSASGREIPADIEMFEKDGKLYLISSVIPDTCFCFPFDGVGNTDPASELFSIIDDDYTWNRIGESIREWLDFLQPENRIGVFSGNAFAEATVMERVQFSYGDLLVLIRRIRSILPEGCSLREILDAFEYDALIPSRNTRFDMKMFDNGKYISFDVLNGEETVATCSADIGDPSSILIIAGVGTADKNYYSRIIMDFSLEHKLIITRKFYADDMKQGYSGLDNNALIMTEIHEIGWTGEPELPENIEYNMIASPANGMIPMNLTAQVSPREEQMAECEFGFSGYEGFSVKITVKKVDDIVAELPEKIIDVSGINENEASDLENTLQKALTPMMLQIIAALPEEYMNVFLNTVH